MTRVSGVRFKAVDLVVNGVVAAIPALLTFLLVHLWLQAGTGDFVPNFWNDQVAYWHKITSFAEVGLETGYYGPDEVGVPWDAVRYSVNGPWFPGAYGAVAAVFGWESATSIYVNMAVLGLAIVAFMRLAGLDLAGSVLTGIVVATTWPVLLYVPTSSQESLNQAFAFVLAGLFVRAIRNGPAISTPEQVAAITLLFIASIYRYSWAILVPVLILLFVGRVTWRSAAAALGVGVMVAALAMALTSAFQPAGNNATLDAFSELTSDPAAGIATIADVTGGNLRELLSPVWLDPTAPIDAPPLEPTLVQTWVILGLSVLALLAVVASLTRVPLPAALRAVPTREAVFHLINVGVTTAAALAFYLPNGYFRVLGAHVLLSLLVLVGSRRVGVLAVIVLMNLVALPGFYRMYESWTPNFGLDRAVVERERAAFSTLIEYDRDPRTPWCNTLVLALPDFDWRVTLVPPGIGISYAQTDEQPLPPRSRYVLLTDNAPGFETAVDRSRLRKLRSSEAGILYENPASLCFRDAG